MKKDSCKKCVWQTGKNCHQDPDNITRAEKLCDSFTDRTRKIETSFSEESSVGTEYFLG
jgi:hypothetical protein